MDSTKLFYFYLCDVWREFMFLVEQNFQEFGEAVVLWAHAMTDRAMPGDWRDRLADFLADWTDEQGTIVEDQSLPVLFDWVAALGRQRGVLPKDPNVVYPEDAWMKCNYRVPVAPTPSSGASGQVIDGVLTMQAKDIGDLTWRDLQRALAAYRLPSDVRALMVLVQGRDPRPFCTIYLSVELLRAFLQLPLADRQSIMSAASAVSVEAAQASITRAVAATTAARNPRQPSLSQQTSSGPKLARSPESPYNSGRNQAAPASPQPVVLAADDVEQKQPAGKGETDATNSPGLLTRKLQYKASGAKIAEYSVHWHDFKLDKPATRPVVLIQHITVAGRNNVVGAVGPIDYYEILGFIPKNQKSLGKIDHWGYVGDVQYPKGNPQITEEEIKQTGRVTAYEYTDALKKVLDTWKPFCPASDGTGISGCWG
jgi:hypothetical protein